MLSHTNLLTPIRLSIPRRSLSPVTLSQFAVRSYIPLPHLFYAPIPSCDLLSASSQPPRLWVLASDGWFIHRPTHCEWSIVMRYVQGYSWRQEQPKEGAIERKAVVQRYGEEGTPQGVIHDQTEGNGQNNAQ